MDQMIRWVVSALLGLVFVGLTMDRLSRTATESGLPYSLLGDIRDTVDGLWPWIRTRPVAPSTTLHPHQTTPHHQNPYVPLSPNLTTCHLSYSRQVLAVYCCPPKPESEEPFIDFEFPDPKTHRVRIRRPVHKLDQAFISKYQKALAKMKSLPYNDPRNFMRQANIHCIFCTGAYNQMHSNSPLNIHRSWLFFPFHRMMIYFHERILASFMDDGDDFALPYWNWDNPEGMLLPQMYMNGSFFDTERDQSHVYPSVADINFGGVESGLSDKDQIETNLRFMYHQMISGAKRTELFMGCAYRSGENGSCNGPGTIELAPHNALHTWVGSNLNPQRENMGTFYAAARDPVFYAHHSNIDRLWEVWRELNEHKLDIHDPEWLDSHFFFHDEKLRLVRVRIRDVLNISKLGYAYEPIDHAWVNARPKPSMPPNIARQILKQNKEQLLQNSVQKQDFGPKGLRVLNTNVRLEVERPKKQRTREDKIREEEVLVVYGIEVVRDVYAKFDVFVNAVNESSIGAESREFAGTFVNVQKGVRHVNKRSSPTVLKLGISELLEDLEADEDESIFVTLVPRGGTGENILVGGIRIEYIR
ncbi:hypothetical protein Sjap_016947 [Stephania japonica]|uniref:Tyrosinase copper-binding domain-containing protein n=1 Tax=Stephania japonica TaxID=461633 RepID=A0AAP0I583_9MAGN